MMQGLVCACDSLLVSIMGIDVKLIIGSFQIQFCD